MARTASSQQRERVYESFGPGESMSLTMQEELGGHITQDYLTEEDTVSEEELLEGLAVTAEYMRTSRRPQPESIIDFAEHPDFLGRDPLYPRQRTLLKLIYLETEHMTSYDEDVINSWVDGFEGPDHWGTTSDIWERVRWCKEAGYEHFREIIFVGGRRAGKGHLGGVMGGREMYRLCGYGSPQKRYGLDQTKTLMLLVAATNFQQARDNLYSDLANFVSAAPCFSDLKWGDTKDSVSLQTAVDGGYMVRQMSTQSRVDREIATVRAKAVTANARAGRGFATYGIMFDEFAHMVALTGGPQTAEEVYEALTPSLDQMRRVAHDVHMKPLYDDKGRVKTIPDGFIYQPYSPYTSIGMAYELYEEALKVYPPGDSREGTPVNPDMLVIQLPSWGPYEDWDDLETAGGYENGFFFPTPIQVYDEAAERKETRNPERFRVEIRAQWAKTEDAYLREEIVERMLEGIVLPDGSVRELQRSNTGVLRWEYRAHIDPSKSEHNTTVVIGHTEPLLLDPDGEGQVWSHVIIDYMNVWEPEDFEDGQIDYEQVEDELIDVFMRFPSLTKISFDQYGSFATVKKMKSVLKSKRHRARVYEYPHTAKKNEARWERMKSAMGMGWVHGYRDNFGPDEKSLLELELKFLRLKNGKVAKQDIGPIQTDDLADAFSMVVSELLLDQLERLQAGEELKGLHVEMGGQGGIRAPGLSQRPVRSSGREQLERNRQERSMGLGNNIDPARGRQQGRGQGGGAYGRPGRPRQGR